MISEERQALELLRQEYGRVTLRKARAYALLSLRGGSSLLADRSRVLSRATVNTLRQNDECVAVALQYWVQAGWHPPHHED